MTESAAEDMTKNAGGREERTPSKGPLGNMDFSTFWTFLLVLLLFFLTFSTFLSYLTHVLLSKMIRGDVCQRYKDPS